MGTTWGREMGTCFRFSLTVGIRGIFYDCLPGLGEFTEISPMFAFVSSVRKLRDSNAWNLTACPLPSTMISKNTMAPLIGYFATNLTPIINLARQSASKSRVWTALGLLPPLSCIFFQSVWLIPLKALLPSYISRFVYRSVYGPVSRTVQAAHVEKIPSPTRDPPADAPQATRLSTSNPSISPPLSFSRTQAE